MNELQANVYFPVDFDPPQKYPTYHDVEMWLAAHQVGWGEYHPEDWSMPLPGEENAQYVMYDYSSATVVPKGTAPTQLTIVLLAIHYVFMREWGDHGLP